MSALLRKVLCYNFFSGMFHDNVFLIISIYGFRFIYRNGFDHRSLIKEHYAKKNIN